MANSGFKRLGNTFIWLCNKSQPADHEWYPYVAEIGRAVAECGAAGDYVRFLVITDGGGPNATQRSASTENDLVKKTKTAVLTNSFLARGIATAYSWYDVRMKAFSPTDLRRALEFLDISTASAVALWAEVMRVAQQIEGGVQTFAIASELLLTATRALPRSKTEHPNL